jgi:hypothetical protein
MSHTCHREGRCTMRPCYLLTAAMGLMLLAGAYLFGCPESPLADRPEPIDPSRFATKADVKSLRDEGLSLFGGLKREVVEAADIEIDAAKKSMADELRKEIFAERLKEVGDRQAWDSWIMEKVHGITARLDKADDKVQSAVKAESVIRGQQILAERSQRQGETGELLASRNKTYDVLLRHQNELTALRKQLFALEQWQLKHRCPEPCRCSHTPPVPAKILPPGCPPNMYTIPYQGAYATPRCPR